MWISMNYTISTMLLFVLFLTLDVFVKQSEKLNNRKMCASPRCSPIYLCVSPRRSMVNRCENLSKQLFMKMLSNSEYLLNKYIATKWFFSHCMHKQQALTLHCTFCVLLIFLSFLLSITYCTSYLNYLSFFYEFLCLSLCYSRLYNLIFIKNKTLPLLHTTNVRSRNVCNGSYLSSKIPI